LVNECHLTFEKARIAIQKATQTLVDSCMDTTHQEFKAQLIEQVQATHAAAIEDRNHGAAIAAANLCKPLLDRWVVGGGDGDPPSTTGNLRKG